MGLWACRVWEFRGLWGVKIADGFPRRLTTRGAGGKTLNPKQTLNPEPTLNPKPSLLGGSWVVISRVTILITHIRGLIAPLITTHEPPSNSRAHSALCFLKEFRGPNRGSQPNIGALIIRIGFL